MTADVYWGGIWTSESGRAKWSAPDPWVVAGVRHFRSRRVRAVLDLGCGVGRHVAFLAEQGFAAYGLDKSPFAVAAARATASAMCAGSTFLVGDMLALPYRSASFDAVLAFNVVYHADEDGVQQALAEVRRVLRPGGIYLVTMLSKRNREYGRGIEMSPNTFRQPDAIDDKVHPHTYSNAEDLTRLHRDFELVSAAEVEQSSPGSYHWHCCFELKRQAGEPSAGR